MDFVLYQERKGEKHIIFRTYDGTAFIYRNEILQGWKILRTVTHLTLGVLHHKNVVNLIDCILETFKFCSIHVISLKGASGGISLSFQGGL